MLAAHLASEFRAATIAGDLIKDVSVITAGVEAIGHGIHTDAKTLTTLLAVASGFKGGVKVKLNHGSSVSDIIGTISGFRIDGQQLRGDLKLLKSSPHFDYVKELIATMPHAVGMSIHFSYTTEDRDEKKFVRIVDLFSCDLVDRPAANPSGLFGAGSNPPPPVTFEAKVQALREAGMSASDAIHKVVAEHEDLYRAYRAKGCGSLKAAPSSAPFPKLVSTQVAKGKTKADAIRFCAHEFPDAYAKWRASGNTATL